MVSLKWPNIVEIYYLSASDIWPYIRGNYSTAHLTFKKTKSINQYLKFKHYQHNDQHLSAERPLCPWQCSNQEEVGVST